MSRIFWGTMNAQESIRFFGNWRGILSLHLSRRRMQKQSGYAQNSQGKFWHSKKLWTTLLYWKKRPLLGPKYISTCSVKKLLHQLRKWISYRFTVITIRIGFRLRDEVKYLRNWGKQRRRWKLNPSRTCPSPPWKLSFFNPGCSFLAIIFRVRLFQNISWHHSQWEMIFTIEFVKI